MFHNLRWQLIAAFGLVILLVVLMSGALSIWMTVSRFDLLVTEEGVAQAEELAPLLEASYAYWGDWRGLDNLLSGLTLATPPDFFFEGVTLDSDVDWWQVSASALGLSDDDLWEQMDEQGSIAAIAEARGSDGDAIVEAIVQAEMDAMDPVSPEEKAQIQDWLQESVTAFVFGELDTGDTSWWPDWYTVVAARLEMSDEALIDALGTGQTIEELAAQRDVPPEQLVEAILKAEEQAMQEAGYSAGEVAGYLDSVREEVRAFLGDRWEATVLSPDPILTEEGAYWLFSNLLLSHNRLLVADEVGRVVFDSEGEMRGEVLPYSMREQGAPLFDQETDEYIGAVIVGAGPGFYNAHQMAFLRGVSTSLAVSGLLAGVLALVVGLLLARRITAPVTALTEASQRVAAGDWSVRLPVRSGDELGQMSAAFNRMAGELGKQRELRHRLVNAVAHELSTPLSVIQLEVEAMRDGMQLPDRAAGNVVREIDLLRGLVDDLSLLAETDAGTLQVHPQPTDLLELVEQARTRWQPQANAAGVTLAVEWAGPEGSGPQVMADPMRIGQVLGNLLSNALRHTPPGGSVTVRVVTNGEQAHVTVHDTGEGVPADDLPHVFEHFYRADRSRSRETGGRGLGLSIVRQVVESHGGRAWAESTVGVGSAFGFSLPLA